MTKKPEAAAPTSAIKFVQICGGADALYALDEHGKVFVYDDQDEGWFQLEFDSTRSLADEVE